MKSRSECLQEYGSDYFVRQKISAGELFRIDKGIYSETEYVPELALVCYKYPNAVVTLNTAFYLYDLTDEIPDEHYLATKREAAPISDKRVKQIFMPKDLLAIGKTTFEEKGFPIPVALSLSFRQQGIGAPFPSVGQTRECRPRPPRQSATIFGICGNERSAIRQSRRTTQPCVFLFLPLP